jgi:hypothetical protein
MIVLLAALLVAIARGIRFEYSVGAKSGQWSLLFDGTKAGGAVTVAGPRVFDAAEMARMTASASDFFLVRVFSAQSDEFPAAQAAARMVRNPYSALCIHGPNTCSDPILFFLHLHVHRHTYSASNLTLTCS